MKRKTKNMRYPPLSSSSPTKKMRALSPSSPIQLIVASPRVLQRMKEKKTGYRLQHVCRLWYHVITVQHSIVKVCRVANCFPKIHEETRHFSCKRILYNNSTAVIGKKKRKRMKNDPIPIKSIRKHPRGTDACYNDCLLFTDYLTCNHWHVYITNHHLRHVRLIHARRCVHRKLREPNGAWPGFDDRKSHS